MTKSFEFVVPGHTLAVATVADVPCDDYFFAVNGNPDRKVFCHRYQGGFPVVTEQGRVFLINLGRIEKPTRGTQIVLVRNSEDPNHRNHTSAAGWILKADWNKVAWAVNARKTFKAVASGHRHNGKSQRNTGKDVTLVENTLLSINKEYPRRQDCDPLSSGYQTKAAGVTYSYDTVIWYRRDPDGVWTECADPRPMAD